jgi:hypothetical protein
MYGFHCANFYETCSAINFCAHLHYWILSKSDKKLENRDRIPFTPVSNMWLLLCPFSWNLLVEDTDRQICVNIPHSLQQLKGVIRREIVNTGVCKVQGLHRSRKWAHWSFAGERKWNQSSCQMQISYAVILRQWLQCPGTVVESCWLQTSAKILYQICDTYQICDIYI